MHIMAGAILALVGAMAVAYIAGGVSALEREPPLLAVGVLLVAIGSGVCARSRTAALVARVGIGAILLLIGWIVVTGWLSSGPARTDESPVRYVQLLGFPIAPPGPARAFPLGTRAPPRPPL